MDLLHRLRQAARRRAVLDDVDGRVDFPLGQLRLELFQCAPLAGRVATELPSGHPVNQGPTRIDGGDHKRRTGEAAGGNAEIDRPLIGAFGAVADKNRGCHGVLQSLALAARFELA